MSAIPAIILLMGEPSTMEGALDTLLESMLAETGFFIALGQALGGLGSILYVFYRIWGHLARNEPIDIFPLLRPVTIAMCLVCYTALADGVVSLNKALDESTRSLVSSKKVQVEALLRQRAQLQQRLAEERASSLLPSDSDGDGEIGMLETMRSWVNIASSWTMSGGAISNGLSNLFDWMLTKIGELMYFMSSLTLKFLQTFFLIVLLITGPITIGLSAFEWFYGSLSSWMARLIHFLLWLPLANLLAGILEQVHIVMLKADIEQMSSLSGIDNMAGDWGLVLFYFMGCAAYLMIPKAAGFIVESSGAGQAISSVQRGMAVQGAIIGGGAGALAGKFNSNKEKQETPPPTQSKV